MFKCQFCHTQQPPHVSPQMTVVATRAMQYVNHNSEGVIIHSQGWEIVKEIALCPSCASAAVAQ